MTITLAGGGTIEIVTPEPATVEAHNVPNVIVTEGGASGGYVIPQPVPSAQWSFPNPTNRLADVTVYTTDGERVEADVWVTPTLITVTFPIPTAGALVIT